MSSIYQAVVLLGLKNVLNIVVGISLRLEIGGSSNVAVVGCYVAKSWHLPPHICKAILNHHESDMLEPDEVDLNYSLANLKMAEVISHNMRGFDDQPDWERIKELAFGFLKINEKDFEELKEDINDKLANAA